MKLNGDIVDEKNKLIPSWNDLSLTIHDLLRYLYGGLLVYAIAGLGWPDYTNGFIEALGVTISVLIAFVLGGVIYTAYRPIIGEIFYFIHLLLHGIFNIRLLRSNYGCTCRTIWLIRYKKVFFLQALDAYRSIRDSEAFNEKRQNRFHKQHSELHTLCITFTVMLTTSFLLKFNLLEQEPTGKLSISVLFIIGIIAFVFAIAGDILLCRQECKCMLEVSKDDIDKILKNGEFIKTKS